jgi:hypothetical protein
MQHFAGSYRSLSLLVGLNWDRILFPAAIFAALISAAYLASF